MYMQLYLNDRCIVYANFMVLVHAEVMFFALSCPLMMGKILKNLYKMVPLAILTPVFGRTITVECLSYDS